MNRGESRLLFVIVVAALLSSLITVLVMRAVVAPAYDEQLRALAQRIDLIETRAAAAAADERIKALTTSGLVPNCAQADAAKVAAEVAETRAAMVDTEPMLERPDVCDEVSCILNNYVGSCCAKYAKPRAVPPGVPDSLDREMIASAIAVVKPRIQACGAATSATGLVKLHVRVAPNGTITTTSVSRTPDAALGACVAAAVGHAVFAKTENGGSFSYPFVF